MKSRLVLAAASACVFAVSLYSVMRTLQFFFKPDANPATVLWSAHAGYYWRALTSAYAAVPVGFAVFLLAERRQAQIVELLARAVRIAAWLVVAQAVLFP